MPECHCGYLKKTTKDKFLIMSNRYWKIPYEKTYNRFLEDDSPIRTAFPVNTQPPERQPPSLPPYSRPPQTGHASGSSHDVSCTAQDTRDNIDLFNKL